MAKAKKKIRWRPWVKVTFGLMVTALTVVVVTQVYEAFGTFASDGKDYQEAQEKTYPNVLHAVVTTSVNGSTHITFIEDLGKPDMEIKAENSHVEGRILTVAFDRDGNIDTTYPTSENSVKKLKEKYSTQYKIVMDKFYNN